MTSIQVRVRVKASNFFAFKYLQQRRKCAEGKYPGGNVLHLDILYGRPEDFPCGQSTDFSPPEQLDNIRISRSWAKVKAIGAKKLVCILFASGLPSSKRQSCQVTKFNISLQIILFLVFVNIISLRLPIELQMFNITVKFKPVQSHQRK